jgi:hypothetical protein
VSWVIIDWHFALAREYLEWSREAAALAGKVKNLKRVRSFMRGASKQVNDQCDDGKKKEHVDQQTGDMVDEKSARPEQE